MPTSSIASASNRSQCSSVGSKRSKELFKKSYVDESLFGEANHIKERNKMLEEKWKNSSGKNVEAEITVNSKTKKQIHDILYHNPKNRQNQKKETVQVISNDLIRELIVPSEDPSGRSTILNYSEFERLKRRSKFLSPQEREELDRIERERKEREMDAVQERRDLMKQADLKRRKNEKLTDLEEEALQKAQYLLQKAMEQRQDQEDEIKKLNELILNAKVQAIRDAQLMEKEVMRKELSQEDLRLDKMMEYDRKNAIAIQEEIEKKREAEEKIGAMQILKQIAENEEERLLELEKKDQENKLQQKRIAELMEEEYQKKIKRHEDQEKLRDELNIANNEMISRKKELKEIDAMKDLQVLEYQREKAEREAEFEREQEKIKAEKEREVARLRALQERANDEQAERDALRAKRAAEDAEREWRKKELEEARKKKDVEDELKLARSQQAAQKQHVLAVQAARDRAEFERVLKAQKEMIEKSKQEEEEVEERRNRYRDEIRRQIRLKEKERIMERNCFFEEGVKMEEEARLRRLRLEEAKERKLRELREAGIPEKYLSQVERKVRQHA